MPTVTKATENGTATHTAAGTIPADPGEALVALQAALPTIAFDRSNPAFKSKYASLTAIVAAVRPLLGQYGFAWITRPTVAHDGSLVLGYQLQHRTGVVVAEGAYPLPSGGTPQALGSAITYARRYTLCAVLGLVAEDDDDGNAASTPGATSRPPVRQTPQRPAEDQPSGTVQPKKAELVGPCPLCAEEGLMANSGQPGALFRQIATGRVQCNGKREDGSYANHGPISPDETLL